MKIRDEVIEKIGSFVYSGRKTTDTGGSDKDGKRRLPLAGGMFNSLKQRYLEEEGHELANQDCVQCSNNLCGAVWAAELDLDK